MSKSADEWLRQADYDLATASYMHAGERYFYAVFMAHLSIEKALKGLYQQRVGEMPPRTHNLVYLSETLELNPPHPLYDFMATLNQVSVPTRYPEELEVLLRQYTDERVGRILAQAESLLAWIKEQL